MRDEAITLVFQGPWTQDSAANIALTKRAFPGARVILSTWAAQADAVPGGLVDELVVSSDPGALPPYKFGKEAPANNINRQILSARAGLARVTTPYVAKIRTDCSLDARAVVAAYERANPPGHGGGRIVVSSFYTLHPEGIEAFQFHVSDWFQFGRTEQVRRYWDVAPMPVAEAVWFEQHPHAATSNYFARCYRARFAPEQYVAVAYARSKGYPVPESIDDAQASPELVAAYERFLVREFVVANPEMLGLTSNKYARLAASHYQFFNCVGSADWQVLQDKQEQSPLAGRTRASGAVPATRNRAQAVSLVRKIDTALPWIKKAGWMPLVGKCLAFYR